MLSAECDKARKDVRNAAAEYIRQGTTLSSWRLDLEKRYAAEKSETLAQADDTMDGKAQRWVEGAVENADDMAKGLYGLANNVLKAAGGDGVAQQTLKEGAGNAWEYVTNPDNWPYLIGTMTPKQREQLALAYEQGDGKTVVKLMGEQVTNVLSARYSGGMVGAVKIVTTADKVEKLLSAINKVSAEIFASRKVVTEEVTSKNTLIQSIPNGMVSMALDDFNV